MSEEELKQIANTFRSFDTMYVDLINFGLRAFSDPIELEWMLEYFIEQEDYEKCIVIKNHIITFKGGDEQI